MKNLNFKEAVDYHGDWRNNYGGTTGAATRYLLGGSIIEGALTGAASGAAAAATMTTPDNPTKLRVALSFFAGCAAGLLSQAAQLSDGQGSNIIGGSTMVGMGVPAALDQIRFRLQAQKLGS